MSRLKYKCNNILNEFNSILSLKLAITQTTKKETNLSNHKLNFFVKIVHHYLGTKYPLGTDEFLENTSTFQKDKFFSISNNNNDKIFLVLLICLTFL